MKKIPLWDTNQESTCAYCQYAKVLTECDQVICQKRKNLYTVAHSCRKFKFDILKKEVCRAKVPDFDQFSSEQFKL